MLDTSRYPALVLNADFTPVSLFPLETWACEDTVHAVIADRVIVVEEYDRVLRSPSLQLPIPSVIALRQYVSQERPAPYNRLNLYVRDHGSCGYCGARIPMDEMTVDHVLPKSRGGPTAYPNCTIACDRCNLTKANKTPGEAGLGLLHRLHHPTLGDLNRTARRMRLAQLERVSREYPAWRAYLMA